MTSPLLLDTSVFIEVERGRAFDVPADVPWGVSSMTIAELNLGVLRAPDTRTRQQRLETYIGAKRAFVFDFDETVAGTYAELVAWGEGEGRRPSVADAIIAATAATHGATLVTLDAGFERLAGFEGLDVRVV